MLEVPQTITPLRWLAETHHQTIQHVAFLLGEKAALQKVQNLLHDLFRGGPITRRALQEAGTLHALFAGQPALAEELIRSAQGTRPDARDPIPDEIGLLAEAFADAFDRTRLQFGGAHKAGTEEEAHD